jgi:hypothetical protein
MNVLCAVRTIQVRPEPEWNQPRFIGQYAFWPHFQPRFIGKYRFLASFSPDLNLPVLLVAHRVLGYWRRRWLHASGP